MSYNLKAIVSSIKKSFDGVDVASNITDPVDYISTGNKAIDLALSGGIFFGYVVEWAGLSQSGKTYMLQTMLANAQEKYDAIGLWVDRENAFTNKRAAELNINLDNTIVVKPKDVPNIPSLSEFIKDSIARIRDKYPESYIFVAIDSLSAFGSSQGGEDMGRKAKQLHSLFRDVIPLVDIRVSLHFTNQVTFLPGVMFGNPKTTTGGEAPKYYTTYRLGLETKKNIKNERGDVLGQWIEFIVDKTRMGPSNRKVIVPFTYDSGIPEFGGYVRMLVSRGIVDPKNRAEFKAFKQKTVLYNDKKYSEDDSEKLLSENPELDLKEWPR